MSHTLEEIRAMRAGQTATPTPSAVVPTTTPKVPVQTTPNIPKVDSGDLGRGKYMSGSLLSKFFDVLSTPQYASAGVADSLVKGKNVFKGIKEGIQNRQSYSDVLGDMGVKNKYVKAIGGFAGDVLLDPSTYIGAGAIKSGLKKIPGLAKGINKIDDVMKVENLVKKVPFLQDVGGLVSNKFRTAGNTAYLDALEKMKQGASMAAEAGADIGQKLIKSPVDFTYGKYVIKAGDIIPDAVQKRISQVIQGGVTGNKEIGDIAAPVIEKFKELANKQVDLGLADEGVFQNLYGKYLPSYLKKKSGEGFGLGGNRINMNRFKTRKVPTTWSGFVQSPAYRAGRGVAEEAKNVATGEFFAKVNTDWAKTAEELATLGNEAKKYVKLPESKNLGMISGKYVPKYIAQDVAGLNRIPSISRNNLLKNYDKAVSVWKAGKTVLSPSQQVRNTISNQILNYMVGGPGATRMLPSSVKEYAKKGDIYKEAKNAGLFAGGFNMNEINKFLPSETTDGILKKSLEKIKSGWNKAVDFGGGIQNTNEEIAKLQQFIYQRSKGKTADEAKKLAEKALFNYGDLTPFEKNVLKRIIPFYTFTRKATPLIAETAVKNPSRLTIFKKGETAINNMTPERANERKMLPSYLKDAIRIPGTKNKYFNAKYIYPWGNTFEESNLPLGMNIPAYDMASKIISGYDPYYGQSLTDSPLPEDMTKAKVGAVSRTLLPSFPTNIIQKQFPKVFGLPDTPTSKKNIGLSLLGAAGFNVYPLDIAKATSQQQYQIKTLQSKITSQIKEAAQMKDTNARDKRIKRLQTYFQSEVKRIMGEK